MAQLATPGVAIALIDGPDTVWSRGFGTTRAGAPDAPAVGADTPFALMSISKTYTGFALMQGVARGLLSLDDPVTRFLPQFTVKSRFGPAASELSVMTLRHLMSHRAGLIHEAPVGNNYGVWQCSLAEHVASIQDTWLRAPVGKEYSYSNLGIDLAGYILEVASGQAFADFVRANIFEPLGMTHSTFSQPQAIADPTLAWGHSGKGPIAPQQVPMAPAGGMFSTAADMARFVSCCLAGGVSPSGQQLLPGALLSEMFTPQAPGPAIGANPTTGKTGYGVGVSIQELAGETLYDHGGGGFGYQTVQRWLPGSGIGVVILTNSSTHPGRHYGLADMALRLAKAAKCEVPGPSSAEWQHFSGTYSAPLYNDSATRSVLQFHGHMYLDEGRLQPHDAVPGLFFTEGGEYVLFGEGDMTAAGVHYVKAG